MLGRIRRHLTFANVASGLCLFILLGGGAYAASKPDTNRATKKFGSSVYFGSVNNFGPTSSGIGIGNGVPLIGRLDTNQGSAAEGGPLTLLAPVPLRFRDFRMKASFAVERPVYLRIYRGDPLFEHVLLGCTIKTGKKVCTAEGPSPKLSPGQTATADLNAPPKPGTLSEHDFLFSFRIVPG
jgi:hypothetical protein